MQPLYERILLSCFCLFSFFALAQTGSEPPIISAEGDQFYCPLTEIAIVSEISISNPDETVIEAFFVQISSGYNRQTDLLKLANDQPNISSSWNSNTAKLTLRSKTNDPLVLTK